MLDARWSECEYSRVCAPDLLLGKLLNVALLALPCYSAAGESANPTKAVPKAIRSVFYRILILYVSTTRNIFRCLPTDTDLLFLPAQLHRNDFLHRHQHVSVGHAYH